MFPCLILGEDSGFTNADVRFTEVKHLPVREMRTETQVSLTWKTELVNGWLNCGPRGIAIWRPTQRIRNLTPYCPAAAEVGVRDSWQCWRQVLFLD